MTKNGDQTNAGGDQSYRVSITPTWEAIAKISIEALLNGTGEGQRMAREEIIDLGIKLDDAKEIIEERLKPTPSLQVQFSETVAQIEEKDKTIAELKERVDKQGKLIDDGITEIDRLQDIQNKSEKRIFALKADIDSANINYISQTEKDLACIRALEEKIAILNQQSDNLEEAKGELQKYWDERNVLQPGLPGIKHEDPVHEQIVDVIHASKVAKTNKLMDEALDLVGVRELMVYTINQQIKHNETHGEDPEYDAELANGDGQDTSIDEQVANNQPHREGDA